MIPVIFGAVALAAGVGYALGGDDKSKQKSESKEVVCVEIPESEVPPHILETLLRGEINFCPYCGAKVRHVDAKFCTSCGNSFVLNKNFGGD